MKYVVEIFQKNKLYFYEKLENDDRKISEIDLELSSIHVDDIWKPKSCDENVHLFDDKNEKIQDENFHFPFVLLSGEEILDGCSSSRSIWIIDIKDVESPKLIDEPIFNDTYSSENGCPSEVIFKRCRISGSLNIDGTFSYLHISCPVMEYKNLLTFNEE